MALKTLVMFKLKYQEKLINSLLEESRKFIKQLSVNDPDASFVPVEDSQIHKEIAQNINTALDLVRKSSQDILIRYELVTKAIKVGLWDMNVVAGDPVNPQNEFNWSNEFRNMLGFTDEDDFPNVLDSWASRLHPDDKEWVLKAFSDHMTDYSGSTPYDVEYRLQMKTGEYRWFRATGTTIRNREGVPLRVAGALFDIQSKKLEQEELQYEKKSSQDILIRYELVTKAIKVGLWDMNVVPVDPINPNNEFIWSDEFRLMLGYKDEEDFPNILDSWASRLHPNDKEWVLKAFNDHMTDYSGNTPYDVEYQLQLKSGEYRWFRATGTTIRNKDGVPLRVAGVLFDIHDKKLKEQELQSEKKTSQDLLIRHELVTKAIKVGLWDMNVVPADPVNLNNEFIWNNEFRQMLGFKDEKDFPNILNSWASRLHPNDREWVLKAFNTHMTDYSGNTPYDVEYQLQLKNGEYRWFRATGTTIRDKNGVPLRVAGALFDIHDKKLQEQEHNYLLERFELINYALTEGPWDMTVVAGDPVNPQNEFWWSPQFRKLLGYYDERDFPNILSSWSERLHPEDKDRVLHAFEEHINDRTGRTPYSLDYRLRMKNGDYRWFHASGATIRNNQGVPLRVAGTIRDITNEKNEVEQSLRMQQFTEDILQKFTEAIQQVVSGLNSVASQTQQQNLTVAQAAGTQEKKSPEKV
jgi:PAS domain S-box-containing protein